MNSQNENHNDYQNDSDYDYLDKEDLEDIEKAMTKRKDRYLHDMYFDVEPIGVRK